MFYEKLVDEILKNRHNNHKDNIDFLRYPEGLEYSFIKRVKLKILSIIPERFILKYRYSSLLRSFLIQPFGNYFEDIEDLYNSLEDTDSKDTLIKVVTFLILRHTKVKLPYNNDFYKNTIKELNLAFKETEKNGYFNISKYGYDLNVKLPLKAVYDTFIYKHYAYKDIEAVKDDIVLDLGGWIGDTALYFSKNVGENGKVFSFEFMPDNLIQFKKNIEKNIEVNNIDIIEKPVWNKSGEVVFITGNGSGAIVGKQRMKDSIELESISIDDFVKNINLKSVDFIKMDIEGAEPMALKGAFKTIQKFKPKLAISIYHNYDDFTKMHKIIKSIEPSYKFYLNHCTMYQEETVLFCKV